MNLKNRLTFFSPLWIETVNLKWSKIKLNKRKQWNFVDCGIVSLGTFWKPHHLVISNSTRQMTWRYAVRGGVVEDGWMNFFSFLSGNCLRGVSTQSHARTHTRTHVQAHTVTYFHIVSFLTSQFHHHQNSILKPQKPLSVARSTFAIYSDPTFPSLWIRFAVQAIKSLHVPLCHL